MRKVSSIRSLLLVDSLNGLFSISALNLNILVPSYKLRNSLSSEIVFEVLLTVWLVVIILGSGVLGGLINFPVEGYQGLLFLLFNLMKFTPGVFLNMLKVFYEDVLFLRIW